MFCKTNLKMHNDYNNFKYFCQKLINPYNEKNSIIYCLNIIIYSL